MIIAQGYKGKTVAVLGLARAGLATVRALLAGGARVFAWDDNASARDAGADMGAEIMDIKNAPWVDIATLFVSPGIAHLYPKPHPIIAEAVRQGVAIDNDIGLFFSLAYFGRKGDLRDGVERQIHDYRAAGACADAAEYTRADGRKYRAGGDGIEPAR